MIFDGAKNKRIMVVGDVMLDRYVYGSIDRISPEAPVPVFLQGHESETVGGAANVALNLKALCPGANVAIFGVIGQDKEGESVHSILGSKGIKDVLCRFKDKRTICKTRFVAQRNHQVMRADREQNAWDQAVIRADLDCHLNDFRPDLVVVSDYAKGVLTSASMELFARYAVPVMLDPKPENMDCYRDKLEPFLNMILIKPNEREALDMFIELAGKSRKCTSIPECIGMLSTYYETDMVITLGNRGMIWFDNEESTSRIEPAVAQEVYDVSGAGDTVMAVLALSRLCDLDLEESCTLANKAAAYVVSKPGTTIADPGIFTI